MRGFGPTGSRTLRVLFFGVGKSATSNWQLSQYTSPVPRSLTLNAPQRSQYFNSMRTSMLSLRSILMIASANFQDDFGCP
jgi:hypothetical protein